MLVFLGACSSLRSGLQSAYNSDVVGRVAKQPVGTKWVNIQGELPNTSYAGSYTVLVFFDPAAKGTESAVEELVALADEFQPQGVVVLGLTDTDAQRLSFFLEEHPLPFPILTESPQDRREFGIKKLFEPEVLLIDPYSRILSNGIRDCRKFLREQR